MTNKKALVRSLHTLLPTKMTEHFVTQNQITGEHTMRTRLNKDGKMQLWLEIAMDEQLWNWHINKLKYPGHNKPPPDPNRPRRPQPPSPPDQSPDEDNNQTSPPPPPPPPPPPEERERRRRREERPPPTKR
jgi:hypothetical protein